jgi:hypothetical protein
MTILQSSENHQADRKTNPQGKEDPKVLQLTTASPDHASENLLSPATTCTMTTTKHPPPIINDHSTTTTTSSFCRTGLKEEIAKQVVRKKLAKLRHLVVEKAICPNYLDTLFPRLLQLFQPQPVIYNGGIANVKNWKISCYLEVMEGGVPTTHPNLELLQLFQPLLDQCNDLFLYWFRQKSACNKNNDTKGSSKKIPLSLGCSRLMTFITRYTPAPGEQALLKVRTCPSKKIPSSHW